ncbi:MAG TPA: class I SAM-dependent methyltransferase [Azospirillaceae bacterium]|nr:class I SAM-dependent methyltransferase [Azospirillaceae bacterium]
MAFRRPPLDLLRCVATGKSEDIALDVYCSPQFLLREFFWLRLRLMVLLIRAMGGHGTSVLDFGGGSGIFAMSLASGFERVTLIDQNTTEAEHLNAHYGLPNLNIVRADILGHDFGEGVFDAVVAADVLEHFLDVDAPITRIHRWLKPDGLLFTSLPTENLWYRILRVMFRKQKPQDHYHTAAEVERRLATLGFRKARGIYHPFVLPLFPLFRISAWRKA